MAESSGTPILVAGEELVAGDDTPRVMALFGGVVNPLKKINLSPPNITMTSSTPAHSLPTPIQSPYPPSSPSTLSSRHLHEIQTIFRIFDPNLNGYIDAQSFEVMTRSLGLRMSSAEVLREVESAWEERMVDFGGELIQLRGAEQRIDLPLVVAILTKRGYGQRSTSDEIQMYFRLFDRDDKGYITLQDMTRVQSEIEQSREELRNELGELDVLGFMSLSGDVLKLMIGEFDRNGDGVIDLEEFRGIVGPMLS
jgi:Ca2+-binding EF-hand superfamily protein